MMKLLLSVALLGLVSSVLAQDSLGREMSRIPFRKVIGNPLKAVVVAQAYAARSTSQFIESVGFTQETDEEGTPVGPRKLLMVNFNYNTTVNGTRIERGMQIPFLYLVPIPFLQFDSVTLEFSVKLSAMAESKSSETVTTNFTRSSYAQSGFNSGYQKSGIFGIQKSSGTAKGTSSSDFSCQVTSTENTKRAMKVQRDYSMTVQVRGSQAPVPGGMVRVLDLFETIIEQDAEALR